jgi:chromosome segregation ATPase
LTSILENEKRSGGSRVEVDRLSTILIQRDTEIRTLNERFFILQSQTSQANEWQYRFNESQKIITQLNSKINTHTQQVSQYESQITQLNQRLNQYQTEITQLNIQLNDYTTRVSQLERQSLQTRVDPQADILRTQVSGLTSKIQQYEIQISQY